MGDVIPGGSKVVHAVTDPEWKPIIETLQTFDSPHMLSPVVLRSEHYGIGVRPSDPKDLSPDQSRVNLSLLDFGTSPFELGCGRVSPNHCEVFERRRALRRGYFSGRPEPLGVVAEPANWVTLAIGPQSPADSEAGALVSDPG